MAEVDVIVGTVGRAHGLRGEVTVRVHSDYAEQRFAAGSVLHRGGVEGDPIEVAHSRLQGDVLLVSFVGVTDRSRAETLRGTELWARVEAGTDDADGFHDGAWSPQYSAIRTPPVARIFSVRSAGWSTPIGR